MKGEMVSRRQLTVSRLAQLVGVNLETFDIMSGTDCCPQSPEPPRVIASFRLTPSGTCVSFEKRYVRVYVVGHSRTFIVGPDQLRGSPRRPDVRERENRRCR